MSKIKTFQIDIDNELLLNANPTQALGAATKQYVDAGPALSGSNLSNGYVVLQNGIIIQWGSANVTSSGSGNSNVIVNFPITFPNAVFSATLGHNQSPDSTVVGSINPFMNSVSTSQIRLGLDENTSSTKTYPVYFIAIGH